MHLYAKDLFEAKYQLLIDKYKRVCLKHCDDPRDFIFFPSDMNDIYER